MDDSPEEMMTKKFLVVNLALTQILMLLCGAVLIIGSDGRLSWAHLLRMTGGSYFGEGLIGGSAALLILQLIFQKWVPKKEREDGINDILIKRFSLPELSLIFFCGAVGEELLFRGIIQSLFGIWIASLIFTLIHFRYWKKPFIMAEVFLMGLMLGYMYRITSLLWIPVLCHFTVNLIIAFMGKKGYID